MEKIYQECQILFLVLQKFFLSILSYPRFLHIFHNISKLSANLLTFPRPKFSLLVYLLYFLLHYSYQHLIHPCKNLQDLYFEEMVSLSCSQFTYFNCFIFIFFKKLKYLFLKCCKAFSRSPKNAILPSANKHTLNTNFK